MSELVYYIPIDNIYKGEESHVYRNVDRKCLDQKLKSFDIDSEPTYKRSEAVVAFNIYDKLVYKTNTIEAHQISRLGINAPTETLIYYEASEEVLESCQTPEESLDYTQAYITSIALIGTLLGVIYYRHMPATDNNNRILLGQDDLNRILLEPPAASSNIFPEDDYEPPLGQDDLNILIGLVNLVPSETHLYGAPAA